MKKKETTVETRDSIINLILTDNKITLSENELKLLQELIQNRWENLKKLDQQTKIFK